MSRTDKPRSPTADPPTLAQVSDPAQPGPADPPLAPADAVDVADVVGTQMLVVDARRVVLAGTAAFALVFVVLLPFWSWLGEHQHRVWLWTALAGTVLGLLALPLVRKHTGEGRLG